MPPDDLPVPPNRSDLSISCLLLRVTWPIGRKKRELAAEEISVEGEGLTGQDGLSPGGARVKTRKSVPDTPPPRFPLPQARDLISAIRKPFVKRPTEFDDEFAIPESDRGNGFFDDPGPTISECPMSLKQPSIDRWISETGFQKNTRPGGFLK